MTTFAGQRKIMDIRVKYIRGIIISILVFCAASHSAEAITPSKSHSIDSICHILKQSRTPADSLLLLYHIFDIDKHRKRSEMFDSIYNVAGRAGDTEAQLDILRQKANYHQSNDSILDEIENIVAKFPISTDANETRVFVSMLRNSRATSSAANDLLIDRISSLIGAYSLNPPADINERIIRLYNICGLISRVTHGEMLEKYVDQLDELIMQMPSHSGAVRNLFYTRCALAFSRNDRHYRAVEADRNLLASIDRLEADYHAHGRKFRNYDRNRYICYRRLLGNYPELSRAEITSYYNAIRELVDKNEEIAADFNNSRRVDIFYQMATNQYDKAIQSIKAELSIQPDSEFRPRYTKFLMEAAKAVGDDKTQLEAALEHNEILKQQLHDKAVEKTRELQIIYDVNGLKAQNIAETMELNHTRRRLKQIAFLMACITVIVLLIAIMVLVRKINQGRQLTLNLAESNKQLSNERDKLERLKGELIKARDQAKIAEQQKSNFINNMSHEVRTPLAAITEYSQLIVDCIPEAQRRYLSRFANIVELNSRLLFTLVSDVLDIASLERTEISIQKKQVDLDKLCQMAVDSVRPLMKPEVEVNFLRGEKNAEIPADEHRITQILTNLLSNGIKFTERGHVTLFYEISTEKRLVRFTVEDTGIGIPAGQEETIFENFRQLDSTVRGTGMGLYIVRLISRLLGASVTVDSSYRQGARFVFTLPY